MIAPRLLSTLQATSPRVSIEPFPESQANADSPPAAKAKEDKRRGKIETRILIKVFSIVFSLFLYSKANISEYNIRRDFVDKKQDFDGTMDAECLNMARGKSQGENTGYTDERYLIFLADS